MYLLALLCLLAIGEARKSYDGYKVLNVFPTTINSTEFLQNLMLTDSQLDFWTEPRRLDKQVDIMTGPLYLDSLKRKLAEANIQYNISIHNVQEHIDSEQERLVASAEAGGESSLNLDDFNNLPKITSWLQSLTKHCPRDMNCKLYSIGKSYEGNPIHVFKISKYGRQRKAYWIDATIHAREWISTATILKIINHFVTQGDKDAVEMVERYDWYFVPVLNPDGYLYTFSEDRYWRKNRRPNPGSTCVGTDLNRNYDFRWGKEGVSRNPCSQVYCGPKAGSEPETMATSAELNRIGSTVIAMVTLHSYAKMWIFPWGNHVGYVGKTCERAEDHHELMRVADLSANAIDGTYNTCWRRGNSCEVIYATTGDSGDYAKGVSGIKYAYCAELRGNDFVINPDQIQLSFKEIYNGIVAMVKATKPK